MPASFHHFTVSTLTHPVAPPVAPQRLPHRWDATPLLPGSHWVLLHWDEKLPATITHFRLSVALDQREAKCVHLLSADGDTLLGTLDLQFPYSCQTFECPIDTRFLPEIERNGLRLRLVKGTNPLWFFSGGIAPCHGASHLLPHFLAPEPAAPASRWEPAYAYLASVGSIQPFGWLEGCVLEGLSTLGDHLPRWKTAAIAAIGTHLDLFFPNGEIIYESPRGLPVDNRFSSMEATLMLPTLLRHRPDHPAIEKASRFWQERYEEGLIGGPGYQKCEVCYTVAYPLALLSRHRSDAAGLALALDQLLRQKAILNQPGIIYQAYYQGNYTFPNWSRGLAWYLLGFARVLEITGTQSSPAAREAAEELARACEWVLSLQREDGLWNVYAHLPETGVETSGTAGIAGALILAHRLGCAGPQALKAARRAVTALEPFLSADGQLHGVCQSNKPEAGDSLQKLGFRCYSQMGLGLAVQAAALLESEPR